ncbi:SIS domain-containing protein [Rubellimicrobium sp. CFH 75288]|uniref:SIS domain-containing protein n=1 Tax=Rubellimicrobium sp. CFH 75288 TaxID=2697034 RepID=UPI001412C7D9|nr:SIS domain-containing protein [Rubellimicrobium sp. CFH 75288]NAZ37580.1 SIS domain-containing protein [Rubellimicrobium sp. CFH 75288]
MIPPLSQTATWAEIQAQPALWEALAASPALAAAHDWLAARSPAEIWLCGAGSSAYLGEIAAAACPVAVQGARVRALATTDLVARPRAFLPAGAVVVQFGRSGDSAESVGLIEALDALAPMMPRLHVTPNPEGALARRPAPGPLHVLLLPEGAHDRGFAMTASFTTMLLAALALLSPEGARPLPALAGRLRDLLPLYAAQAEGMRTPERLVFLGTGPLAFAAREAALKVMELAAGAIPCLWDTPLGFRHGPKSVVRGATDIVLLRSPDPHAALYEADLAAELREQFPDSRVLSVGPGGEIDVPLPEGEGWGAALLVPFAQILAATLSHRLGLPVDDPFAGRGTLSRVVRGVRLHPVAP